MRRRGPLVATRAGERVDREDREGRRADRHEHVGADAGRLVARLALDADRRSEHGRDQGPDEEIDLERDIARHPGKDSGRPGALRSSGSLTSTTWASKRADEVGRSEVDVDPECAAADREDRLVGRRPHRGSPAMDGLEPNGVIV